jgi:hypothetical protein
LRTIEIAENLHFAITNFKEVWSRLRPANENPEDTSVLVTDSEGIVALAKRQFETLWNDPSARILLPKKKEHNSLIVQN